MNRIEICAMEPERLIAYLGEPHENYELTFAAEEAGRVDDAHWPAARIALLELLNHKSALVREGAVYGLASHVDDVVRSVLEDVRMYDASPGVRDAAYEALDYSKGSEE